MDIDAPDAQLIRAIAQSALFAAALAVLLAVALIMARGQLPTDLSGVALALAAAAWPILGPVTLSRRNSARSDAACWFGIWTVILLLAPFILMNLGPVGGIAIYAGAIGFLLFTTRSALATPPVRSLLWLTLLLVCAIVLALQIGSSKYVNFFADQLALFGRTDGDVYSHGAITNSLRYLGVPSMAIDGVRQLHYHFGVNVLAAALAQARDLDATYAMVLLKVLVLVPLLVGTASNGALLFAEASEGTIGAHTSASPLRYLAWTVFFTALLPATGLGNILVNSESMLLGGILLLCCAPSLLALWAHERTGTGATSWIFWIVMIPVIAIGKISIGAVWLGLVGYSALRTYGLARLATWVIALSALAAFAMGFWFVNSPSDMGAAWFGEPFYLERGWKEGDYTLPLRLHLEWVLAVIGLWLLTRVGGASGTRNLIELLLITALGANLPGLLMKIPGGDAVYFIIASDWLALPIVIVCCAALVGREGASSFRGRAMPVALLIVAALLIWSAVAPIKLGWRHFLAANALLRTGDLTYYDDDHRKPVKEDAERAWNEIDHATLLAGPRAEPPASGLLTKLAALRAQHGAEAALYVAPDVDSFWSYVRDCDVSSLLPVAMTGLQMIDGSYPDQTKCRQEIGRRGYADVPEIRPARSDEQLCALAHDRGIKVILSIGDLTDRARDRLLECAE